MLPLWVTFVALAAGLTVGIVVGMWGHSKFWPRCPEPNCRRDLLCPVDDATQIRMVQQSAGPRPTADVR